MTFRGKTLKSCDEIVTNGSFTSSGNTYINYLLNGMKQHVAIDRTFKDIRIEENKFAARSTL
jgi:hypothetical protein